MKALFFGFLLLPMSLAAQNGWKYIGPVEREISHMSIKGDLIFASVAIPPVGGGYYTRLIYRSTDGGTTWDLLDTNLIHRSASITILNGSPPKLIGAINSRLYYSDDLGVTWDSTQQNNPPLFRFHDKGNVPGLVFGIGESFFSRDRLFRSTDYGRTWTEPYPFPASSDGSDMVIGLSSSSADMFVNVDTNIGGNSFFHSSNNGATWEYIGTGVNTSYLEVDRNDSSWMYSLLRSVQKSTDSGLSWSVITMGFTELLITLIQDFDNPYKMFMQAYRDSRAGVYSSNDRGMTWQFDSTSTLLPNVQSNNPQSQQRLFQYDSKRKRLYIGTTKGIYFRDFSITRITNSNREENFYLYFYPHPAKSEVFFSTGTIGPNRSGSLLIYNTLGKTVHFKTIEREGLYRWDLVGPNGSRIPNGLYFIRFQDGSDFIIKKLIVQNGFH